MNKFIEVEEIATYLETTPDQIRRLLRDDPDFCPRRKIGGRWKILRTEWAEWLTQKGMES